MNVVWMLILVLVNTVYAVVPPPNTYRIKQNVLSQDYQITRVYKAVKKKHSDEHVTPEQKLNHALYELSERSIHVATVGREVQFTIPKYAFYSSDCPEMTSFSKYAWSSLKDLLRQGDKEMIFVEALAEDEMTAARLLKQARVIREYLDTPAVKAPVVHYSSAAFAAKSELPYWQRVGVQEPTIVIHYHLSSGQSPLIVE